MMVALRGKGVKFDGATQDTQHRVSDEEVVAFSNTLNQIMKENDYWKEGNEHGNTQIDSTDKESLFFQFKNGIYMLDLLHTIDTNNDAGILLKAINRG